MKITFHCEEHGEILETSVLPKDELARFQRSLWSATPKIDDKPGRDIRLEPGSEVKLPALYHDGCGKALRVAYD